MDRMCLPSSSMWCSLLRCQDRHLSQLNYLNQSFLKKHQTTEKQLITAGKWRWFVDAFYLGIFEPHIRWSQFSAHKYPPPKPHLSTKTTSRMLMMPKATANKAGAVYMLSCRSMIFTVTPCSPMNDRHACRADISKDIQMFKIKSTTFP